MYVSLTGLTMSERWRFYGPDGDVIITGDDMKDCMRQFIADYQGWDSKTMKIERVEDDE